MRKLLLLCLAAVAIMMIAGCEGQNKKNNLGHGDSLLLDSMAEQDSSLYGRCGEDCAMNTLQTHLR